jgi:threonyl-tRNA synthetase
VEQFAILPISEKYNDYAEKVSQLLNNYDIRGFVDDRNEKIGKKIREAELAKVPFMLIVGEKEAESQSVSVRQRGVGDHGSMELDAFVELIQKTIEDELSSAVN